MRRRHRHARIPGLAAFVALAGLLTAAPAGAMTFTFDDLGPSHGRIMNSQYAASGLVISAINIGGGPDLAVLFDSERTGTTADPDLQIPAAGLGHLLIIQEHSGSCNGSFCTNPDDEGSRPAGIIRLDFADGIRSFGLTLVDVEGSEEMGSLLFFQERGPALVQVGSVPFSTLPGSFVDRSVVVVAPILASAFDNAFAFNRVEVHMGGSGGIDNLRVDFNVVPEPASLSLLALGLLGLTASGRRRLKRS